MQTLAGRAARERVAAKFVENEFEKTDRLLELYFQYHSSWQRAAARLEAMQVPRRVFVCSMLQFICCWTWSHELQRSGNS